MPTYEYACKACGQHLEVVQSFKDEPLTTCPACGGALRKVFGSIGVAFKGSGFYRTDNARTTRRDAEAKAKAEAKTSDGAKAESGAKGESGAKSESSGSAPAKSESAKIESSASKSDSKGAEKSA